MDQIEEYSVGSLALDGSQSKRRTTQNSKPGKGIHSAVFPKNAQLPDNKERECVELESNDILRLEGIRHFK